MSGEARVAIEESLYCVADIRNIIQFEYLLAGSGRLGGGSEEKYFDVR